MDMKADTVIRDKLGFTLEDWILALLAYSGGTIEGATRIQKGLFLVKMEIEGTVPADYVPGDYGPYSVDVSRAIEALKKKGLITETRGNWGDESQARVFTLTSDGKKKAKKVLEILKKSKEWNKIEEYIRTATKDPLMRLLVIVYNWYPEYSKVSKIRRKVDYWTRKMLKWNF
ncbi:MAG: hypothetical protein GSR77_03785 [Desulfurococcales archaeon]|nr:hypothetical protein [Desulfurococcales archaeon]